MGNSRLDPKLRKKLLNESRYPFRGLRRAIWGTLFGSAILGLIIMSLRTASGETVLINDLSIQISALLLFGTLLWVDRSKS